MENKVKRHMAQDTSALHPPPSIVVTKKNEEKNIGNCLKSIKALYGEKIL